MSEGAISLFIVQAACEALAQRGPLRERFEEALAARDVVDSGVARAAAAVLGVEGFERLVRRATTSTSPQVTLPDVSFEARQVDGSVTQADLEAALSLWASAVAREGRVVTVAHPYEAQLAQLRSAREAIDGAPVLVSHPLTQLMAALDVRNPAAAYLYLRDTAEGVARLAWLLLVLETLDAALAQEDLHGLDPQGRKALSTLMERVAGRSFSFGDAVRILTGERDDGRDSVLALLCRSPWSERLQLSGSLRDDLSQPGLRASLLQLRDWRNQDIGHGIIGGEHRLHRLLRHDDAGGPDVVRALVTLLVGLGQWLRDVGAWTSERGWPALSGLSVPPTTAGAPEPIAWVGGGAPLWVLDGVERDSVRVLDVLAGGRTRRQRWARTADLAALMMLAARTTLPLDEDMQGLQRLDSAARATWEGRRWTSSLPKRVLHAADEQRLVHIIGRGGTGKSFLLREVEAQLAREREMLSDTVVVSFRGHAGIPISAALVLHALHRTLEQLPEPVRAALSPSGARIIPEVATALAWWTALADSNSGVQFTILVDGLEEIDRLHAGVEEVLPWADPRYRIVVATRPRADLPAAVLSLADRLAEHGGRIIDLDEHYSGADGTEEMRAYLLARHRGIAHRHEEILRLARGSGPLLFLHVFHFARGFEVGFEPAVSDSGVLWSYADYLAWMERRAHGHPGYVRCLRSILLTLAEAPLGINERTLRALMGAPQHESSARGPGFIEWQPWVLRDIEDFVARRRLSSPPASPADGSVADIVWFDASVRPIDGSVLQPAHVELTRYLRSAELPDDWRKVRDELRTIRRNLVTDLLMRDDFGTSSEERYIFAVEGPASFFVDGILDEALLERWRCHVPRSFLGAGRPSYWVATLHRALELSLPTEATAALLLSLGRALEADHGASAALDAFRAAAEAARLVAGVSPELSDAEIRKCVAASPASSATLAAALEATARHWAARNRRIGREPAEEALRLRRQLRSLPGDIRASDLAYADSLALAAYASTRTNSAAGQMAARRVPPELTWIGEAAGIYAHHLSLAQPLTMRDVQAVVAKDEPTLLGLVRVLAEGVEVAVVYDLVEVALAMAEDIRTCIDAWSLRGAVGRYDYDKLRPAFIALVSVANAHQHAGGHEEALKVYETAEELLRTHAPDRAVGHATFGRDYANLLLGVNEQHLGRARAHREVRMYEACEANARDGARILLELAHVDEAVTDEALSLAIATRPDAMKTLVVGLLQVPKVLRLVSTSSYGSVALDLALRVTRLWSGLEPSASDERRREGTLTCSWAHQALSEVLEQYARYWAARGKLEPAGSALRECEALIRSAGRSNYPYMPELAEPRAKPDRRSESD